MLSCNFINQKLGGVIHEGKSVHKMKDILRNPKKSYMEIREISNLVDNRDLTL